jgi:DNA-binding beta-propeller fold protein YncE
MIRRLARLLLLAALVDAASTGPAAAEACTGDCNRDGQVLVDEVVLGVNLALGTEPTASCYAYDRNFDDAVTVDEILTAVSLALEGCPAPQTTAFVTTTDFETGAFATIDLAQRRVVLPAAPARQINADSIARDFDGRVYVVNRFGLEGDAIQARDPQRDFAVDWDCSTGAGGNPQDIAFAAPDKAYVTLLESTQLLVIDPSVSRSCAGFVRGTIDLSAFADDDGVPEMASMMLVDDVLYVTLQRLDRNDLFSPNGNGIVVAIDTVNDTVIRAIGLAGENPFSRMVRRGNQLWLSSVGWFATRDGGIEAIDFTTNAPLGVQIPEAALGGDITDFVIVSDDIGYAVISADDFRNELIEFSPRTGTRTRTLIGGSSFIAQIQATERGELYVADRSFSTPGLRIFDIRSGMPVPESPLDLGLPPFDISFLR